MQPRTRPTRLRFLAAFLTSATAAFLLTQLLAVGEADEPKRKAADEDGLLAARMPAQGAAEPSDPKPAPAKPKRTARKVLPVKDFGGY